MDTHSEASTNDQLISDFGGVVADKSVYRFLFLAIASVLTGILLFYYVFGRIGEFEIRGTFLAFIMALCFFPKSRDAKAKQIFDCFLAAIAVAANIYFIFNRTQMSLKFFRLDTLDLIMGILLIALVLEGCRRKVGMAMPGIAVVFILYGFYGHLIPGKYGTSQFSISRVVNILYTGGEGIYGTAIGVMVSTVFLFILFGGLLQTTGTGQFFIDIAKAVCGKSIGGTAKIGVGTAMLFGSISGSAVANTVATGSFTIPMMKESGYKPSFAAAVIATASTGGQMMPPVMGAGAFLIAEMTKTSYERIVLISIVPAIMFYAAIYLAVHFEAKKKNLKGLDPDQVPDAKEVLRKEGLSGLPLLILLGLVIFGGTSIIYSALVAMAVLVVLGLARCKGRDRYMFILDGIQEAAPSAVTTAICCACAGIVIGMISLTGLGFNFSKTLMSLSSGNLFLALILVMLLGLVLGMGLPTTPAFILMISVAGAGLVNIGLPLLTAYIVIFWFSQTSNITPPVCMAAYAAAGISGSRPMDVGFKAIRIGFPIVIIPFLMAYRSLLFTGTPFESIMTILTGSLGIIGFTIFCMGYCKTSLVWYEYILIGIASVGTFWPSYLGDTIGIAAFGLFMLLHYRRAGRVAIPIMPAVE